MDVDYDDLGRPKPLSGEEIEEFRRAFQMFDSDSSGTISAQELILVMENLNMNPSEKDISGLLKVQKKSMNWSLHFDKSLIVYQALSL